MKPSLLPMLLLATTLAHGAGRELPFEGDYLQSDRTLLEAMESALEKVTIDRSHDIPYLAGYSRDGKTIYIHREMPRHFRGSRGKVEVDRFLALHEIVEKALESYPGLRYQHAHQIALRTERAAVEAAGIPWEDYDAFMQRWIERAAKKTERIPRDLDLTPYRDEEDRELLAKMTRSMRR